MHSLSQESQIALARFDTAADRVMKLCHPTVKFSKVLRGALAHINYAELSSLRALTAEEEEV
jgi:hypothetical protein